MKPGKEILGFHFFAGRRVAKRQVGLLKVADVVAQWVENGELKEIRFRAEMAE